jgi:hypothetical protein
VTLPDPGEPSGVSVLHVGLGRSTTRSRSTRSPKRWSARRRAPAGRRATGVRRSPVRRREPLPAAVRVDDDRVGRGVALELGEQRSGQRGGATRSAASTTTTSVGTCSAAARARAGRRGGPHADGVRRQAGVGPGGPRHTHRSVGHRGHDVRAGPAGDEQAGLVDRPCVGWAAVEHDGRIRSPAGTTTLRASTAADAEVGSSCCCSAVDPVPAGLERPNGDFAVHPAEQRRSVARPDPDALTTRTRHLRRSAASPRLRCSCSPAPRSPFAGQDDSVVAHRQPGRRHRRRLAASLVDRGRSRSRRTAAGGSGRGSRHAAVAKKVAARRQLRRPLPPRPLLRRRLLPRRRLLRQLPPATPSTSGLRQRPRSQAATTGQLVLWSSSPCGSPRTTTAATSGSPSSRLAPPVVTSGVPRAPTRLRPHAPRLSERGHAEHRCRPRPADLRRRGHWPQPLRRV